MAIREPRVSKWRPLPSPEIGFSKKIERREEDVQNQGRPRRPDGEAHQPIEAGQRGAARDPAQEVAREHVDRDIDSEEGDERRGQEAPQRCPAQSGRQERAESKSRRPADKARHHDPRQVGQLKDPARHRPEDGEEQHQAPDHGDRGSPAGSHGMRQDFPLSES